MILIVAVDDRNGMMFNKRRQSRDKVLCEKILKITSGSRLWMNTYTSKLFAECEDVKNIIVDEDFLSKSEKDDYCFAENFLPEESDVDKLIMFKWNRKYPGDFYFDLDISSWNMSKTEEFAGSSHENITMEVYER